MGLVIMIGFETGYLQILFIDRLKTKGAKFGCFGALLIVVIESSIRSSMDRIIGRPAELLARNLHW